MVPRQLQLSRLTTKGEVDSALVSEEVGREWERAAFDSLEEKRRAFCCDDTTVDLRDLEVSGDFSFDLDELTLATKEGEELAQVTRCSGICHGWSARSAARERAVCLREADLSPSRRTSI